MFKWRDYFNCIFVVVWYDILGSYVMWFKGYRLRFVLWRKWNKNEIKIYFCFVNLWIEKKIVVKKGCDLWFVMWVSIYFIKKFFKSLNEEFVLIYMYIVVYR